MKADLSDEMQAEHEEDRRRKPGERILPLDEGRAECRRAKAQEHEDRRHPQRESDGRDDQPGLRPRCQGGSALLTAQLLHAEPGHVRQVERHDRQNARREERQEPGKRGTPKSCIKTHLPILVARSVLA